MDPLLALVPGQPFTIQDLTTNGLDQRKVWNWGWCLDYQLKYHYGFSPWVERGYAKSAHCIYLPPHADVPSGAWPIHLKDVSDISGALGYHDDLFISKVGPSGVHSLNGITDGGTPFAEVFVKTSEEDGVDPLEVASHEALEMIVDPYVANNAEVRKVLNHQKKEYYIVEVGDPVQGNGYELVPGFVLADFAWPAWWGMDQTRPNMSYRSSVRNAWEVGPEGYMNVSPENEPYNWRPIYGEKAPHTPNPL